MECWVEVFSYDFWGWNCDMWIFYEENLWKINLMNSEWGCDYLDRYRIWLNIFYFILVFLIYEIWGFYKGGGFFCLN